MSRLSGELKLALVSKTGSGKSSLGNLLLERDAFRLESGFGSGTSECSAISGRIQGREVTIVDTPGTMDTRDKNAPLMELTKMINLSPDGFHAFLIVVRCGARYTDEEHEAIEALMKLFGESFLRFAIVVFTHGKVFNNSERELRAALAKARSNQRQLDTLLSQCGDRIALVESGADEDPSVQKRQIEALMALVDKLVLRNRNRTYTNKYFEEAQRELEKQRQAEESRRREKQELEMELKRELQRMQQQLSHLSRSEREREMQKQRTEAEYQKQLLDKDHEIQRMQQQMYSMQQQLQTLSRDLERRGGSRRSCSIQ